MTYSMATQEYLKVCFSYYFNLNLPKDEDGRVNDNIMYYLGIKEFLEKNFRDINNDSNDSVYKEWEQYREKAKKKAKDILMQNRL